MFTVSMVLLGVALPALLAAAILAVPLLRPAAADGGRRGAALLPLALGAAVLAGHWGLKGLPRVPPAESSEWLFVVALAATLLGIVEALRPAPTAVRWAVREVVALAATGALLRGALRHTHGTVEAVLVVAAIAAGILGTWALLDATASRARGPGFPLSLAAIAGGGAIAVGLSGSQLLAQLGGALACAATAAAALAWFAPPVRTGSWGAGATAVPALAMPAVWLASRFYADLPWSSLALLAVSPSFALAGALGPLDRLGPRAGAVAQAGLASLPVALAIVLAHAASPRFDF